jgi:c-di-GMP-binding flagellar brake protein YcgR
MTYPKDSALLNEEEPAFAGSTGLDALASTDRRRFARITSLKVASVSLQGVSARLLDLGLGGALVESPVRLIPGAVTSVRLSVRDIKLQTRACIRRASVAGFARTLDEATPVYQSGLEFQSLSPAERRAVRALLSEAERSVGPTRAVQSAVRAFRAHTSTSDADSANSPVFVRFPPGWTVTRRNATIVAREPHARGFIFLRPFPGSASGDLCEFAQLTMGEAGFTTMDCRPAAVNGLAACVGFYHGWLHDMGEVIAEAAFVTFNDRLYLVAGVASWTAYETLRNEFFTTIRSFEERRPGDGVSVDAVDRDPAGEDEADSNRRNCLRCAGPFDGRRAGLLETPIRIYDLSEGGCFINAVHQAPADGQTLDLKIQLPFEGWIAVRAMVVYQRPGFGFAVRFINVADHIRARIVRAIQKLQALRGKA